MNIHQVVTRQVSEYVRTDCNLCGAQNIVDANSYHFDISNEYQSGWGDLFGDRMRFDLCRECFEERMAPAIKAVGIDLERVGSDNSRTELPTKAG